ncbi:MAG: asparagine synthetase B, partial [Bacteroidota bacterium]
MIKKFLIWLVVLLTLSGSLRAAFILIPMDDDQKNHLKAYGIAYWVLQNSVEVKWLLNYRGGSFLIPGLPDIESECIVRGVSYEVIADVQAN